MRTIGLLLLIAILPLSASAADKPSTKHHSQLEDFLGQTVLSIEIRGPKWAEELGLNMPLHKGMPLTRDRLNRAVRHFYLNRMADLVAVRAAAQPMEVGARKGIQVIFRIEPVHQITKVEFEDNRNMDTGALHRAAGLPTGVDFWPDTVDRSARQIALLYQRAGWRETEVEWWATKAQGGLAITFIVHRSEPTQLIKLEFPGDKHLSDEEMNDVFPIKPGDQLNMDSVEEGIAELKSLLRAHHYYRAEVGIPAVDSGFEQATVTIPVNAGPQMVLQVRGNRSIDDDTLLEHLHYSGDESLDAATEQDLAKRLTELYELAGYPLAAVKVRETPPTIPRVTPKVRPKHEASEPSPPEALAAHSSREYARIGPPGILSLETDVPQNASQSPTLDEWGPPPDWADGYHAGMNELLSSDHGVPALALPPDNKVRTIPPARDVPIGGPAFFSVDSDIPAGPAPRVRTVTFLITEGPSIRVVGRSITGDKLAGHPDGELRRRLDIALEDAVPEDLVNKLDESWIRAAQLGGAPGEVLARHPRVQPHEVFSKLGYKNGCEQIANLYKALGYLDVTVGPAQLVPQQGDEAIVVVNIKQGPQSVVDSVPLVGGVREMGANLVQAAVKVHVGEPLSYANIDDSEKAIVDLYRKNGYLSATITDEEKARTNDPNKYQVVFTVVEGVQVRVSGIEFVGANHTPHDLVEKAVMLHTGDIITPEKLTGSVRNLLNLGTFTSASVDPKSPTSLETALVVRVQERPSLSADAGGGISEVDGPRAKAQFVAAHFLGSTNAFTASAKINVPVFRICEYGLITCVPGAQQPSDPVEWRGTVGLAFPVFGKSDEPPQDQKLDLIAQNVLRPAYYLTKFSVLGTINGLPHWRWGPDVKNPDFLITTEFQAEIERDQFERTSNNPLLFNLSLADQAASRLPSGPTQLLSLRPQITFDWRKGVDRDNKPNKNNPSSGGLVTFLLDFSRSFDAVIPEKILEGTKVALISALATAGGYIPIYRPKRVVFVLNGRVGEVFSEPWAQVIGTKVFFLGGTATLRGFAEDSLVPQDIRQADHAGVAACNQLASGLGCSPSSLSLLQTSASNSISPGGSFVVAGRGELRFALGDSLDGNVFFDAGNLWSDPRLVDMRELRYATGFGVSYPLPIGPAAFDLGFNLAPDTLVGESVVQLHFALGM